MGDLGILKRRPSGWTPGRAFALKHRSRERNPNVTPAVPSTVYLDPDDEGGVALG